MTVKVSFVQFDTTATPVDVRVSWLQFNPVAAPPTNVKVSWFEFNTVGTAYETRVSWFQFNPTAFPVSEPLSFRGQVFSKTLDVSTVATIVESAFVSESSPSVFWGRSYTGYIVASDAREPLLITTRSQLKALSSGAKAAVLGQPKLATTKSVRVKNAPVYASTQTTSDYASVRDTSVRVGTKQADMFVTDKPKRQALKSNL